jgi:hypothetical protein
MGIVETPAPFDGLAAALAGSPGLIDALLAEHRDDGTGHCRTCTTMPGYGTKDVLVPCPLRTLAEYAARLYPVRVPR